jgi:hypothetical protein
VSAANEVLDRLQTLASVDVFVADPGRYATELAQEVRAIATLAELETRDAQLAGALRHIDDTIARVMRLRLDHALATRGDSSIATPTRKVFSATVIDYAGDLTRLADRARDIAARGGARDPDAIAALVVDAARASLALRADLRAGVLAVIRDLSMAAIPEVDGRAKDRTLPDNQRKQWSAARRDLEILAADPERILVAPLAARLAAWPEQLDEPAPESQPTFADMIELD